jgi:glycosyltransferase involved in cell wall biosynthesis
MSHDKPVLTPISSAADLPVSVILPVHNGMPFIEESVRSILNQSFADFELLIGDDGSSDGTTATLQRLAAQDARIRLLRRETASGLAASANWLAREARAPLIAIMHADDLSLPNRLARQVAILNSDRNVQLVGTLWEGIDEEGRGVRPADFWRLFRSSPFAPFSHSSIMFRRSAFERAGGYRSMAEYWEDLDLYFRIAAVGTIAVIPEVLAKVRHARTSTRLRDAQEKVENQVDLMFRAVAEVAAGEDPDAVICAGPRGGRLRPITFVSCGSTNVWNGRSPQVLARLHQRASLKANRESIRALAWVLWGSASPKSLRWFLKSVLRMRNAIAIPLLKGRPFIRWSPTSL